jgi:flagellar biosynthesis/type III secretory pathway chaperone
MQSTEQLAELITRKHQVLVQLCAVGTRQMDLVVNGETALLLKLLAAKQSLISALKNLERELAPFHEEAPAQRKWPSPEARAACAQQARECNEMLQTIVAMEQMGAEKMTIRRNEIASQLQQVHTAAQVRSAYESQRLRPAANGP